MLVEISGDALESYGKTRENIKFYEELNAVVSGKRYADSIGKSTFLMILDFVSGRENYTVESIMILKKLARIIGSR